MRHTHQAKYQNPGMPSMVLLASTSDGKMECPKLMGMQIVDLRCKLIHPSGISTSWDFDPRFFSSRVIVNGSGEYGFCRPEQLQH